MPFSYSSYIPKRPRNASRENKILKTMQENSATPQTQLKFPYDT